VRGGSVVVRMPVSLWDLMGVVGLLLVMAFA
jgi:hypothetical protein